MKITVQDREFVRQAALYLERPTFLVRVTDLIGRPLEAALAKLPHKAKLKLATVSQASLSKALNYATQTIDKSSLKSSDRGHVFLAGASGAVGGFFGLAALPVELPLTTVMMLRSIASIANEYGHNIDDPYVQMDCLSVFSMGAPTKADDSINSAYFTSRVAMARMIEEAAQFLAKKTVKDVSHPVLARFISAVASRFEIVLTEKAAAQSVPVLGAITGALINSAFMDHFNTVARYHFGLKALEKEYGMIQIRSEYLKYQK